MSIVDSWNWDKLDTSEYDKDIKMMNADIKVLSALDDFENRYGIRPNRIIMGYNLVNELSAMFCPVRKFEQVDKEVRGYICEYEGIPVKVDYDNPSNLEVGYMVKWMEEKYE